MNSNRTKLIEILREARALLARPDNDFAWSSWKDAPAALREIDDIISRIKSDEMPKRREIRVLFLPTGPIQEVGINSGWGQEFIELASRFDQVLSSEPPRR